MTSNRGSALLGAGAWLDSLLDGQLPIVVCSIAMAVLGLAMFGGRLNIRRGAKLILGCFLVLGASTIATGLTQQSDNSIVEAEILVSPSVAPDLPQKKSQQTNDPYAGASLAQ